MRKLISWLKWLKEGRPYLTYTGATCGCCGSWYDETYKIPEYKSLGWWWDTIGICPTCMGESDE